MIMLGYKWDVRFEQGCNWQLAGGIMETFKRRQLCSLTKKNAKSSRFVTICRINAAEPTFFILVQESSVENSCTIFTRCPSFACQWAKCPLPIACPFPPTRNGRFRT